MNYKAFGLITILMVAASLVIGFAAILPFSPLHATFYAILVVASLLGIVFIFCSKCLCHEKQCSHIILGSIVSILPKKAMGPYKGTDYWGVGVCLFLLIAYPSYWLWKHPVLPYIFYPLVAVAMALILLKVCPYCGNTYCPFHRNPGNSK